MSLEAVQYVKEAEERAQRIQKDGEKEAKSLIREANEKIADKREKMKAELSDYEKNLQSQYEKQLAQKQEEADNERRVETKKMQQLADSKRPEVVKHILKEVINRYGNS